MSTSDLRTLISAQKADALAATQSAKLTLERERNDRYYMGDMEVDLPSEDGRSEAVSTDVSDVIEGLMPHLMDIFAGSDEVVRFEPVGPEDEVAAQQETDYVNHVFMQQNPGFMVLYTFIKDALLSKNGVAKIWWEEYEREQREDYEDLTDDQFAMLAQAVLMSEGGLKIVAHTMEQEEGQPPSHDVTVIETKKYTCARVLGVPPEEFGIERNARDIKTCNYAFNDICTKTRADWIGDGYDEQQVMSLPEYTGLQTAETLARDTVWEHASGGQTSTNKSAQVVKVTEHYVRMDYEGNGKPRLYQVVTGGDDGAILIRDGKDAVEEYDMMPFAAATPVPVPHRFFGRAIADLIIQVQKEKTAIKRGALDNLYLHNNPRVEVAEASAGPNTLDDLLVSRPGGIVRTKTAGGLNWQVVPDITASIYPMLQYLDSELETKTGLAKQSQGIDANALQNQSATAVAQVFSASQMRIKLIARVLAEGIKDIFSLLHATIRKHGGQAQTVRLRNQWVNIDPREWKTRDDMTVNVGLGNGSKAQQFAQAMALANVQKELIAGGKGHMVGDDKLFNMATELCKIMGYRNPDRFFDDPTETDPQTGQLKHPPAPPPPDPKLQIEQMKQQGQLAVNAQKAQQEERKAQLDAVHEQIQAQADIEVARFKAQVDTMLAALDARLKMTTAAQDHAHKQEQHRMDMAGKVMDMAATAHAHDTKMEVMKDQAKNKPKADA
jgi:hypothetical protein